MKKTILSITMICAATMMQAQKPAIPRDAVLEAKIEKTLAKMTLDEKIGQMLELNLDIIGKMTVENAKVDREKVRSVMQQYGRSEAEIKDLLKMTDQQIIDKLGGFPVDIYQGDTKRVWKLNEQMLDTLISKWKVGSILNAPGTKAPTVAQWQQWIQLIQKKSMKYLGIPDIYGLDHNHGVTYTQGGTLFPQPINLGASFNTELARRGAEITAYESRAANCPWVYNPVVDLSRDPRWPRVYESFGEDAIVNSKMVTAEIKGYQGDDNNHIDQYHVGTSTKHYFAYGAPWTGKDRTPAYLSPQMIREKYFEPFKAAALAGTLTMMVNSASVNGVPVHASYEYLTKWLKEDLQWDGFLVTDWADINNLFSREHVAKDKKDAIRIAINAGIDMSMDPYSVEFCILLKELVQEGKVKMSRIDDAVRRILRAKYRLGLFEKPNTGGKGFEKFGSAEFAAASLKAAEESEVLLKNEGNILPLAKGKKILLTGPNANQMRCLHGGWSYTWQGSKAEELSEKYNTIYEALCNKYGKENIILEQGVTYNENGAYYDENEPQIDKAVAAADKADVIIACIGENSYTETPGNLNDLWLSANQRNLVKALAKTGKPIVMVLNEGRPRLIADIEPLAKAVVDILIPGNYGGDALANLLAGDANFSAKMPYTYPREINSLNTYDYKVSEEVGTMAGAYNYDAKVSLQWPFGYGISYTTYEYSNLKVDKKQFTAADVLTVSVDVKNTGAKAGKEAVLLYSSDLVASIVPDNKRLRDFTKIELQPGEVKTVTFQLPAKNLAFVGTDGKWTLEEGDFILKVGNQTVGTACTQTKIWDEPNI
ncbi:MULTISPECIES: glycoside hydrolase family 3 N-terminal domain-containing protein [Prevotellaceae]|uniref:glycoside hydrolase family 3 N-terminal domain-containing protein n=1 Tax=Prevotellaceae TaxID=171552 RepID=UPI000B8964C4|nr:MULTISPECIES: glycoside hydrolase family 3 N-terminal domain-containing protein [Prevotellaceae]QVJ79687.1 glycoside hydrolase family 3 C-terminal domain-containing protein [Xylanibacter ruminicola]